LGAGTAATLTDFVRLEATSVHAGTAPGRSARLLARWVLVSLALVAVLAALVGLAFAGSPTRIAEGVAIAGVDVGGLTPTQARSLLERRFDRVAHVPVVFTAGDRRYPIKATTLSVEADWDSAIKTAAHQGEGFGPVRGFRRLQTKFFGAEIAPPVQAYGAALDFKLAGLAQAIDQRHVEAKLVRRGLGIEIVAGQPGRRLDLRAAGATIVRALAQLERGPQVALPVRIDPVNVTAADLAPAARQARIALSAPVRLRLGETRWKLPRWRIAEILSLPAGGETRLAIAGPGAEAWFERLRKTVEHAPVDATFAVEPGGVEVVPDKPGVGIDVPATAKSLLTAATSPTARTAELAVRTTKAERSTAEAEAMGITGIVGSYYTTYGGIPSRLHNVALVAQLIDGALIAPGATFSFNGTTGERTAEKGFQEAPVIINGELQTGLGGGICQVSTTVFNAAYEAGLEIDERFNHALYISHYPLGRDATVNYPDQDLKFTNDTDKWLLLRTFVGSGSLTVNLYGTPQNRRVETAEQPLRIVAAPRVKRVPDPTMLKGTSVVEEYGQPARATSVRRTVYDAEGTVLHEDTWYSSYRSEPKIVRVGTKPKPKPGPKAKPKPPAVDPLDPAATETIPEAPPASTPLP
jgi:vancomycin resistance protein YoaR